MSGFRSPSNKTKQGQTMAVTLTIEEVRQLLREGVECRRDIEARLKRMERVVDTDALSAEVSRLRAERDLAEKQIAQLRSEIAQLNDRCESYSEDVNSLNSCLTKLEEALYASRDEAANLRYERRMFRRRLVECLPWVGKTPFPNTPAFSEMLATLDLAKDTLKEVPE